MNSLEYIDNGVMDSGRELINSMPPDQAVRQVRLSDHRGSASSIVKLHNRYLRPTVDNSKLNSPSSAEFKNRPKSNENSFLNGGRRSSVK